MAISLCLVHNKWRITRRIGGGSFGEIYMGVGPNLEKVAVKFEKESSRCPQLRHEYKVYRELVNCHGFCCVYYFGAQDSHNVMVMDLMGPSLEDLFNKCARKFSLKTVLQIADQLLERADTLHARHLIHRDIKPANFVIGIGDQGANVYCVDFGLSKRYRHPKTLQHIPHRDGRSLTGTPRYASINNHLGIEQSRRDDLESIAYILIYFLKGTLPWQGLKAKNASKKYLLILSKKQSVSIAQLCQGCPSQFAEFLAYSRSLKFDAKPDIPYLRKIFRDLYNTQGCASVGKMWDWDAIDADYFTNSSGGQAAAAVPGGVIGPPAILSAGHQLRPTTSAAVAAPGDFEFNKGGGLFNSSRGSRAEEEDEEGGYGSNAKKAADTRPSIIEQLRPSTTSAQNRQQAPTQAQFMQWGFARPSGAGGVLPAGIKGDPRTQTGGQGGLDYGQESSQNRRPHTANIVRTPDGQNNGEGGEAHVVAGARAMMRYRNNKSVDGTTPINGGGVTGAAALVAASGVGGGGMKGWSSSQGANGALSAGIAGQGAGGAGKYPAVGGASAGVGSGFQAQQRSSAPKPAPSSSAQGPGWVVSDRPRSAAVSNTNATRTTPTPATNGGNSNTLSYGSLKNRFLSGTGGGSGSTGKADGPSPYGVPSGGSSGSGAKASGASKLFASLAR